MSVHPSLSSKGKGKRSRSVLKRYERLREMQEKEKWKPGDSVFGLLKLKTLRWKMKKAKKAVEAEAAAPAGEQAQEAPAAETAAAKKEATPTKKEQKR